MDNKTSPLGMATQHGFQFSIDMATKLKYVPIFSPDFQPLHATSKKTNGWIRLPDSSGNTPTNSVGEGFTLGISTSSRPGDVNQTNLGPLPGRMGKPPLKWPVSK